MGGLLGGLFGPPRGRATDRITVVPQPVPQPKPTGIYATGLPVRQQGRARVSFAGADDTQSELFAAKEPTWLVGIVTNNEDFRWAMGRLEFFIGPASKNVALPETTASTTVTRMPDRYVITRELIGSKSLSTTEFAPGSRGNVFWAGIVFMNTGESLYAICKSAMAGASFVRITWFTVPFRTAPFWIPNPGNAGDGGLHGEHGNFRVVTGGDPAAQAEASDAVPTNAMWRLIAYQIQIVGIAGDSAAPRLIVETPTRIRKFQGGLQDAITGAETETFVWTEGYGNITLAAPATITDTETISLRAELPPDLWMSEADIVRTLTSGTFGATSNYGAPSITIEEKVEP